MFYHILRKIVAVAAVVCGIAVADAVEPTWSIDFGSVFDNREGDEGMNEARTFFFTTLAPEFGLRFSPKDRIAGGAVWTQPLENGVKDGKVIPTLYYRHESDTWKFSMGMFPRTQLREPLPGFLWCDSLAYFQRNIRGALVQYNHRHGFFDAYIDWRAMQSETRREAFNIVFHGEWRPKSKVFLTGAHAQMNHLAKTKNAPEGQSVVDNFLVNPYVGLDFSRATALDSLVVKAGALATIERDRRFGGWKTPAGLWVDAIFEWRFLGLRNSLYAGGKLFPLYSEYGSLLYQGESYYRSDFYNRTDIYARIFDNRYLDLQAQLNFNLAKGNFIFYQRLILNIHLDGVFGRGRSSRHPL